MAYIRFQAVLSRSTVNGESVSRGRVLYLSIRRSVKSSWSSVLIRSFFGGLLNRESQVISIRSGIWSNITSI